MADPDDQHHTSVFGLGPSPWQQKRIDVSTSETEDPSPADEQDEDLVRDLQTVEKPALGVIRTGFIGLRTTQAGLAPAPAAEPPPLFARALGGAHAYSDSDESGNVGQAADFAKPNHFSRPTAQPPYLTHPQMPQPPQKSEDEVVEEDLRRLQLCRNYFLLGCCGLPLLQLVNALHFRRELVGHSDIDAHPMTKLYARLSAGIGMFQLLIMLIWYLVWRSTEQLDLLNVLRTKPNFELV